MSGTEIITGIILFVAYIVFDFLYGWYVIAVQSFKITLATVLSLMIGAISYGGVIKIVDNPWYGVPIILGGGIGTFIILKWQKSKVKNQVDIKKDKI